MELSYFIPQAMPSPSNESSTQRIRSSFNRKKKYTDENDEPQCKIFHRRPGTRNQGNSYEDIVTANFTLKLLTCNKIEKFYISSNDNDFEHFDDIVFETVTFNGVRETVAIQLKHFENTEEFQSECLGFGNKNGKIKSKGLKKFNLKEYANLNDNEQSCDRLILFTNKKFAPDLEERKILEFDENNDKFLFEVKIVKIDNTDDVLNTIHGCMYRFEIISEIKMNDSTRKKTTFEKFQLFFSKFFLYTDQTGACDMEEQFTTNFRETFDCEVSHVEKYIKFITQWNNLKKTNTLCKQFLSRFLTSLLLQIQTTSTYSFSVLNEKAKLLREGIEKFDITVFNDSFIIKEIWDEANETEILNCEEEENGKKHVCRHMKLDNLENLEQPQKSWFLNKRPLIVIKDSVYKKVMNILSPRNIVVIQETQMIDTYYPAHFSVFRCLADLRSEPDIYHQILEKFEISLQGRKPVNLRFLSNIDKKFEEIITPDELMMMIDGVLVVGGQKEQLPTTYVERKISTKIVHENFLEDCDKEAFVVISHFNNFPEFRNQHTNFHFIDLDTSNTNGSKQKSDSKKNIYVTKGKCSKENMKKMFDGKETNVSYLLRLRKDGFLEYMRHDKDDGYFDQFVQERYEQETDVYNKEFDENIELIVANPGMGKSTLTKNLKNNLNSKYFTIIIQATDVPMYFAHVDTQNAADSFVKIISKSTFDKNILDIFKINHSIMFVWDAVDELSNKNLDKVMHIIDTLSHEGFPQWVTSRDHLIKTLEENFVTFAKTIAPFNEDQQETYIKKRLQEKYPDNLENIVDAIKTNIRHFRYDEILAIPLQIYMLTSIFYENPQKYVNLVDSTFSVIHLYRYFLEEKFKIYFKDKLKVVESNDRLLDELEERKKDYEEQYGMCAIKILFGVNVDIKNFFTKTEKEGDFPGLITRITTDGVAVFIHPSFGEFFAALYFYRHPECISDLKNIIFDPRYNNVRFMFDVLMAEDNPCHLTVLHGKMPDLRIAKKEDKCGRTPLHLICSWGNRYLTLERHFVGITEHHDFREKKYVDGYYSKYYDDYDDDFYKKSVQKENENYEQIVTCLLQSSFSYSQRDTLYAMNAIDYANVTQCLFALILISKREAADLSALKLCNDLSTLLFYTIKFDQVHILNLINDIPLVKTCIAGNSLLHLAVKYSAENCVRKLLENKNHRNTIDFPNNQKFLPIHAASKNGNVNILKMLTDGSGKTADVNARTHRDNTPLHIACSNKHKEVVELLIELNADVNLTNKNKETPTHIAAKEGYNEIVETLLHTCPGPLRQIDWRDINEDTPLHHASHKGHNHTVKLLIDLGADINCAGHYGRRPIHYACEKGHTNTVILLEQLGADLNSKDEGGKTPLHYTSLEGWLTLTRFILERRGDIVNFSNNNGNISLHQESCEGSNNNISIVKKLCELDADIDSRNKRGQKLFNLTCPWGRYFAEKMMIESGAGVNSQENDVRTPLPQVAECSWDACREIIKFLVSKGASINAPDRYGQTPLHHASVAGNDKKNQNVVKLLLKLGADVNSQDKDGVTPLCLAAKWGHDKILRLLKPEVVTFQQIFD